MSTQFSTQPEISNCEVSIYSDNIVTRHEAVKQIEKLKFAFPDIQNGYIALLTERILEHKFTKKRLQDAVNFCIDNFQYKLPNISNIISYDQKVKVYTYNDILDFNHITGTAFKDFKRIKKTVNGSLYASVIDIEKFKLEMLK